MASIQEPDSDIDVGSDAGSDENQELVERDGFADMMSRILNQNAGDSIPVLSKRKTPLMREHEEESNMKNLLKKQKVDKKVDKEKQLVAPDVRSADFERELRRLATRGGMTMLYFVTMLYSIVLC